MWIDQLPKSNFEQDDVRVLEDLFALFDRIRNRNPNLASSIIQPLINRSLAKGFEPTELRRTVERFYHPDENIAWDQLRPNEPQDKQQLLLGLLVANRQAIDAAKRLVVDSKQSPVVRQDLLRFVADESPETARQMLVEVLKLEAQRTPLDRSWRDTAIDLGIEKYQPSEQANLAEWIPKLPIDLQASIAERMTQREPTASDLLRWISEGKLRKELLSPNRIRLLATQGSQSAKTLVAKVFGTVNVDDNQERDKVVRAMSDRLKGGLRGDAKQGWVVYERICGQCHIIHDRGIEVGPNITANGRGSFEQLLVSVFNPSLVIGDAYRSVTIRTTDGTVVTGLLISRDDRKTVVKTQGGKEVSVQAEDIEIFQQDKKSLMPEGIESQMTPQEMADLFALLSLEKAPGTQDNSTISGTPDKLHSKQ
jgi:putative heme-binding domain-containing protein